ncbi:MAG: endolytic transglycosylase MltG [Solirubrobacteraceae bacterium]
MARAAPAPPPAPPAAPGSFIDEPLDDEAFFDDPHLDGHETASHEFTEEEWDDEWVEDDGVDGHHAGHAAGAATVAPAASSGRGGPKRPGRTKAPAASGGRRRRWLPVLLIAAGLLVVGVLWFLNALFQPLKGSGETGSSPIAVRIQKGSSLDEISTKLADAGVVDSAFFFKLRAKLDGRTSDFKPGRYLFQPGISYVAAMDALTKGPPPPKTSKFTITEGRTRQEINRLLKKTSLQGSYLAATVRSRYLNPRNYGAPKSTRSLEGFLFPATYDVRVGAPVSDLVRKQLIAFKANLATVNLAKARKRNLTAYDVLIIASMIEKEAALDRERPLIASVIYNRLKQDVPLGIDATIRYGVGNFDSPLKQSELDRDTPYNTRLHAGLPPTPIGNPGLASIRAAANPAATGYLFYVVKPGTCGQHNFSKTLDQFNKDAAAYEAARQKAGGKSPDTC